MRFCTKYDVFVSRVCIIAFLGYNISKEGTVMKINEYLKIRRKEMNLTLLDVAKVCGVSEATVVGI